MAIRYGQIGVAHAHANKIEVYRASKDFEVVGVVEPNKELRERAMNSDAASHRRSVYRFIARSQPDPFMTTLDCADSSQSTPQRTETLTSLQALSLLNNNFNLVMAKSFAERVAASGEDMPAQVEFAFRLVTGRDPDASEKSALVEYAKTHGLTNLSRVMFNLSELVFVD